MNHKPRIIVLQTSTYGLQNCKDLLLRMGLLEGPDFALLHSFHEIEGLLEKGSRQLLITGSIRNSNRGISLFVESARNTNNQLVCVSYASLSIPGAFESVVTKEKNNSLAELKQVVENFLNGSLVRRLTSWEQQRLAAHE